MAGVTLSLYLIILCSSNSSSCNTCKHSKNRSCMYNDKMLHCFNSFTTTALKMLDFTFLPFKHIFKNFKMF